MTMVTRLQLLLSIVLITISLIALSYDTRTATTSIASNIFGLIALSLYHILCYIRKAHSDVAKKRHKVFGRIQPFGLLLSSFMLATISLFARIDFSDFQVHNEHIANDESFLMHHQSAHESDDMSARTSHTRLLLSVMEPIDEISSDKINQNRQLNQINNNDKIGNDMNRPNGGLNNIDVEQIRQRIKPMKFGDVNEKGRDINQDNMQQINDQKLREKEHYDQKQKELENILYGIDSDEGKVRKPGIDSDEVIIGSNINPDYSIMGFLFWSLFIYFVFVCFFILLNSHLLFLELRLYELIFGISNLSWNVMNSSNRSDKLEDNSITGSGATLIQTLRKSVISNKNDTSSETSNISVNMDGGNDDPERSLLSKTSKSKDKSKNARKPKWAKFIFCYVMLSIQFVGIISTLLIDAVRSDYGVTFYRLITTVSLLCGSELSIRVFDKLKVSPRPRWLTSLLTILFGSMAGVEVHRHGHTHHSHSTSHGSNQSMIFTFCSIFCNLSSFIQHIRENRSSRRIFIFLSLNFSFMFIEFLWGYWTNSLGLISDAIHMLLDCISLVIGLFASYLGSPHSLAIRTKNDPYHDKFLHSFGHGRIKVLSGFINGIFLIYIGVSVLIEAFERILHPPHIHTEQLLIVATLGLLVNIVGLVFFHDAHMAGHGGHCSHDHGDHGHGHDHGHHHHHDHDHNLYGIFLHILADTLGSVGVIVSSIIIYVWEIYVFDALCSVFISLLIFVAVYPLISSTSKILLEETPNHIINALKNDLSMVLSIPGVIGYRLPHFWEYEPGRIIGTIHIQIEENKDTNIVGNGISSSINSSNNKNTNKHNNNKKMRNEQEILTQVTNVITRRFGMNSKDLTIQIEKNQYLDSIDPIHHSVYNDFVRVHKIGSNKLSNMNSLNSIAAMNAINSMNTLNGNNSSRKKLRTHNHRSHGGHLHSGHSHSHSRGHSHDDHQSHDNHDGHSHGHKHGHGHSHSNHSNHSHSHSEHDHDHDHGHGHCDSDDGHGHDHHDHSHDGHDHGHGHSHEDGHHHGHNDNDNDNNNNGNVNIFSLESFLSPNSTSHDGHNHDDHNDNDHHNHNHGEHSHDQYGHHGHSHGNHVTSI